ncbi:hypothetical protein FQA39_LY01465 [Lamprigera yunnana]|nr:hypothetical protein FQA39_LY01465 [Lamprigera yunnana]
MGCENVNVITTQRDSVTQSENKRFDHADVYQGPRSRLKTPEKMNQQTHMATKTMRSWFGLGEKVAKRKPPRSYKKPKTGRSDLIYKRQLNLSDCSQFRHSVDQLKNIQSNLGKDPISRRENIDAINSKFKLINKLNREFMEIKYCFNKEKHSEVTLDVGERYVEVIEKYLKTITDILNSRIQYSSDTINISNYNTNLENLDFKMKKCCLKTAGSLLPLMDGTEDVTMRLINSIELYNTLLDENGKKLLITFVLKTRLSENAKVGLQSTYNQCSELIADLKKPL